MAQSTRKRNKKSPKAAPEKVEEYKCPAPEKVEEYKCPAPEKVEKYKCPASIRRVFHTITFDEDYPVDVTHYVKLELQNSEGFLQAYFEFPLEAASGVAAFRRFLGGYDFPLVDERGIDAACARIVGACCEVLVDSGRVTSEDCVLNVWAVEGDNDQPDSRDDEDVWNHELHVKLRREDFWRRSETSE
jgi:hypothetical protein